jgi:hypothetical protein
MKASEIRCDSRQDRILDNAVFIPRMGYYHFRFSRRTNVLPVGIDWTCISSIHGG